MTTLRELGITLKDGEILLFYISTNGLLQFVASQDGKDFNSHPQKITVAGENKKVDYSNLRISKLKDNYFLTYKLQSTKNTSLYGAVSKDLIYWESVGEIAGIKETSMVVPDYQYKGRYVMYFGEELIKVAFSENLKKWGIAKHFVIKSSDSGFDRSPLELGGVIPIDESILVVYYVKNRAGQKPTRYSVGAALFDQKDPESPFWRSPEPLWEQPEDWNLEEVSPLGVIYLDKKLVLYWKVGERGVFTTSCYLPQKIALLTGDDFSLTLKRFEKNPIIKPIPEHWWESKATFNSAAIFEDGKVHFLYRAIGDNDISVLGYASSSDGLNIDERLDKPAYIPTEPFECPNSKSRAFYSPFASGGGGNGGCEDPRLTKIGDRFYMTYVAHDGTNHPRAAITSIKVDDFLNKRWDWEKPKLISGVGVVNKNACILPDKINGKYVIFHRVFPNILIDFVDDLNFNEYLRGDFCIEPRQNSWDSLKVGAGPPPLKTEDGWLLIYHAVGHQDRGRYKVGAMLLDLEDPTKILCRSNIPILEPSEHYENEGHKAGVAYPCGATIVKDRLFVYYGGADTVLCAANQNLKTFLSELKSSHSARLEPINYTVNFLH